MSLNSQNPIFLYAYQSKSSSPAFAIEIYWGAAFDYGSNGYQVNPLRINKWKGWFDEYVVKHDFRIEDIEKYGTEPSLVCRELNKNLSGQDVFTNQIERTKSLLEEVFAVTDETEMRFNLKPLDKLFQMKLKEKGIPETEISKKLKELNAKARSELLLNCAAVEILHLQKLWQMILRLNNK